MWTIQKEIDSKWEIVVENISDEDLANEWIAMKKRNQPNDKFRKVRTTN